MICDAMRPRMPLAQGCRSKLSARSFCGNYAGQTVSIFNPDTGKVDFEAQIFIATLGASNYSFAEATFSQTLPDWIKSHIRALEFFGGVPQIMVPDNLKSGVTHPCRYEPDVNPTYLDLARHYGTTVIPARPGKPKDKAKVESAVLIVERWILAALRNHRFFSLAELNQAISEKLTVNIDYHVEVDCHY